VGKRIRLFVGIAALIGFTAPIASASSPPSIVLGHSILGVRLGETVEQLRVQFPNVKLETVRGETTFFLPGLRGGFSSQGVITGFYTAADGQRTAKGIHTTNAVGSRITHGSSAAAIRKAYPKAKCSKPGVPEAQSIICSLKSRYLGKNVETTFTIYSPSVGVAEIGIQFT
jgi:hypothetical protein